MPILDEIVAFGHENVLCTHNTTIEITKDAYLTKRGNCILGIRATKSCADLSNPLKDFIKKGSKIKVIIKSGNIYDEFYGYGDIDLELTHIKDIVFRTSSFICDRTILINCSKAAKDLDIELINSLKEPNATFSIIFKSD